jgi:hypothetical protein
MCEVLNVDDEWIRQNLEVPAGEVRHGKVTPITADDRQKAMEAARAMIQRFILFVKRGESKLPIGDFPVLRLP